MVSKEYDVACQHAVAQHKLRLDEVSRAHAEQLEQDAHTADQYLAELAALLDKAYQQARDYFDKALGSNIYAPKTVDLPPPQLPVSPYAAEQQQQHEYEQKQHQAQQHPVQQQQPQSPPVQPRAVQKARPTPPAPPPRPQVHHPQPQPQPRQLPAVPPRRLSNG